MLTFILLLYSCHNLIELENYARKAFLHKTELHQISYKLHGNIYKDSEKSRLPLRTRPHLFAVRCKQAEESHWELLQQDDWDYIPHRIELMYANKSYGEVTECQFVKYNRTYRRTLNASMHLIKPLDEKNLVVKFRCYKFLSNTYKYFPINVEINLCKEYERNTFNIRELLTNHSNIHECPSKPGFLYVTYLPWDPSKLPPFMPRGDYKQKLELFNGDDKVFQVDIYLSVVDKPKEWK